MVIINEENSVTQPEETSEHNFSDTELREAELKKIKAEQTKLIAEAQEINRRLSQKWYHIKPSAFIQVIIAGIVAGGFIGAFMLDNFLKIHTVNVEVQKDLIDENNELENRQAELDAEINELENRQAEFDTQITDLQRINKQQEDEINALKQQRQEELAEAQQNLEAIKNQPDLSQQDEITANKTIADLKKQISNLEERAKIFQNTAIELNKLTKSRLEKFRILIRYNSNSPQAKRDAMNIKSILSDINLNNVEIREISTSEMNNRWGASDYQIRYFENTERNEANILQQKIQASSEIGLRLQEASTESPEFLSIFLP